MEYDDLLIKAWNCSCFWNADVDFAPLKDHVWNSIPDKNLIERLFPLGSSPARKVCLKLEFEGSNSREPPNKKFYLLPVLTTVFNISVKLDLDIFQWHLNREKKAGLSCRE